MKLVIQPECQVGPVKLRITHNNQILHKMDLSGHYSSRDETIYLASGISAEQIFNILVHELLHICSDESGADLEENQITGTSYLLTQALLSLGIEPDFSQLPKEGKE